MQAIVLVGGFGTRLRPLTIGTPKQMLPIVDRPMIEWVIARLATYGVERAVLSLGYRPEAFIEAYPDGRCCGVELAYAVEPEPLDTAGAIAFAAHDAGVDETAIVLNGDVISEQNLGLLLDHHRTSGATGTIALTPVDDPSRYGVVPIAEDGRVLDFIEKPEPGSAPTNWINAGAYVLEPQALADVAPDRRVSIERETFPDMVASGSLHAVQLPGYWIDAGTPETYRSVQLDLTRGDEAPDRVHGTAAMEPGAVVEDSILMQGVVVRAGAKIRGSIVLPGATIGTDVSVVDSIIGPRATLGKAASLSELTVIGADTEVEAGAQLVSERLPATPD